MSQKTIGSDALAPALTAAAQDSADQARIVCERIARFRGEDNSSMMGGWT